MQGGRDVECRRVPNVVGERLERRTEDADAGVEHRPAARLEREIDDTLTLRHVDLVDLLHETDDLARAELARAVHEGADVLREAPAAEAEPCVEEAAPDPVVEADRVGEGGDVGIRCGAQLGDRVDERDLGGEERVRAHLDQHRRLEAHREQRRPLGDRPRVHLAHRSFRGLRRAPDDDAVGVKGVLDGLALAQDLRIPDELRR